MNDFKTLIQAYSNLIFKIGLILTILCTLFLFTNLTTEFYDTPKFIALVIFTCLLLLLLALKFTLSGKVVLVRSPLDLPLLLILAVAIVSTILSPSPYVALLGNQLRIHGSLVSLIAYVLFYFVLINQLKSPKEVKWIVYFTLIASQILAVVSLLSFAGLKLLPAPWVQSSNFTPAGTAFSTAAILALLIPIAVSQILSHTTSTTKIFNAVMLTVMGITIILTGSLATWVAAVFALILSFFILSPVKDLTQLNRLNPASIAALGIPLVIFIVVAVLANIPPIGGAKNPIYTQSQSFPREIQLDFVNSWKIAVSAFRDLPVWGTAPSTFLFDFTNYKPVEFNSTKAWNLRFDSPFNEYLLFLATLGGVGIIGLLSLTAMFISASYATLIRHSLAVHEGRNGDHDFKAALAIAGLTFFVILALHASSLVLWVVGIIILAGFMVLNLTTGAQNSWGRPQDFKNMLFRVVSNISSQNSTEETIRIDTLPSILLTIILGATLAVFFFGAKLVLADYHHKLALNAVNQNNGVMAYNELVAAEKFNPVNDLYRTDLAQVNFALANAIAAAKGPTQASPAGSLTDQDKQNIQTLLQQSVNEGKNAVTLSPKSAIDWEILALLYRQIAGVAQNALLFSLDAYGRAIFQDPYNPLLRLSVGGTYYAAKSYDSAIRFFNDSINLKPDFANGYYNLSVALRDKGDLNSALQAAQKVVDLVDKNSQDYKIATDYLNDLKTKAGVPTQPPAASTSGELQNEQLPKVVDVGKPQKIATPEAIKKPAPTPTPNQ